MPIVNLFLEAGPVGKAADSPEIHPDVRECLERHGLPPDELRKRFDDPKIANILELKIQGEPYRKIAEKYDCVISTVRGWLDSEGVKLEYVPGQSHGEVPAKIHLPQRDGKPAIVLRLADEALIGAGDAPKRDQPQTGPRQRGVLFPDPIFEEPKILPAPEIPPRRADWRDLAIEARKDRDERRGKVEDAAVEAVAEFYRKHGYEVKSVETKNLGWDLEFRKGGGGGLLRVEVKGKKCAEWPEIQVELTRNEREQSENPDYRDSYRLAIVRDALGNPKCAIYTRDGDGWKRAGDFAGDDGDAPACLMMGPTKNFVVWAP